MRVQADVSDADAVRTLIAEVVDNFGKIDVLVNNAFRPYVFSPEERTRFPDLAWEHYQSQFDGAVRATFSMCQAVLPFMQRQARGSIINMTSDLVERPSIAYHDYATAKSALVGFSRNLAAEVGAIGVWVNCVAPGLVYPTDASRATKEGVKEMLIAQTPLKRIATPSDITGPVLFLASNWSQFITGQTLVVDGGLVMT